MSLFHNVFPEPKLSQDSICLTKVIPLAQQWLQSHCLIPFTGQPALSVTDDWPISYVNLDIPAGEPSSVFLVEDGAISSADKWTEDTSLPFSGLEGHVRDG